MDLIVPANAAQLVVRYKPGDLARCADEIGAALIDLRAPIFVRGEGQKRRLYWRDDKDVYWPLNNESFPRVAALIGLRCERWNERLGCYEAGWPPGGVVVAAVGRLLFRNWPTATDYRRNWSL